MQITLEINELAKILGSYWGVTLDTDALSLAQNSAGDTVLEIRNAPMEALFTRAEAPVPFASPYPDVPQGTPPYVGRTSTSDKIVFTGATSDTLDDVGDADEGVLTMDDILGLSSAAEKDRSILKTDTVVKALATKSYGKAPPITAEELSGGDLR